MGKSELPGEAVGSTEGLSCESSQVIDMLWLAGSEEWLEQGDPEDAHPSRHLRATHRRRLRG